MRRCLLALLFAGAGFAQLQPPKDLDLFLLIGQSNMAGRGVVTEAEKKPSVGVWMLTEKLEWVPAVDPLHFDKPAIAGVGLGRSFAESLLRNRPGAAIGLIPAAFGGSALDEWKPDGKHYPNALARAREAMKHGKLRGILWHQGEADAKADLAGTYCERFTKFVARLRQDLGAGEVPVIVGELGEFYQPDSEWPKKVNEQLRQAAKEIPKVAFVPSKGLQHKGDKVHFDTPSLQQFGRQYAMAFQKLDPSWSIVTVASTPDRKAWGAANVIKDPAKKVAALEKFKADFPESPQAENVDEVIFQTLVRKLPEQKKRIMRLARERYRGASAAQAGRVANDIAVEFLDAGIYLREAERYSKLCVKRLNEAAFLAEERARAEKRKQKAPPEEESRRKFREMRAARLATLGRIQVKRGNRKGQKLLEEAWKENPGLTPVAAALGELAMTAGDNQKAIDYLTAVRLSGRATVSAAANFETVYRKLHKGSFDGAEEFLDQEYRKRFPNPAHAERYQPTAARTGRVVLAELFTGAGCPPCQAANLALDVVLERYARKDVAVVVYHQHIPRPDPLTNPMGTARRESYGIRGVPTLAVDGKARTGGGNRDYAPQAFRDFDAEIRKALEDPAGAKLTVKAALANGTIRVQGVAEAVQGDGKAQRQAVIVLVEKELRYTGENGIRFHPMVARAAVTVPVAGAKQELSAAFDLSRIAADNKKHLDDYEKQRTEPFRFSMKKHEMDEARLAVVVFVEDPAAHKVLQTVWVEVDR